MFTNEQKNLRRAQCAPNSQTKVNKLYRDLVSTKSVMPHELQKLTLS